MAEVVVLASFCARRGREAEAEKFLWDLLAPTHAEDGCVLYALHRGTDNPRRLALIERWESRDLLEKHRATTLQDAGEQLKELFSEEPDIALYWSVPGGTREKGSLSGQST